ncbi:MAG: CRISPR-associated ring nuclease Csm6, partial [Gallionellaceae bacterium]
MQLEQSLPHEYSRRVLLAVAGTTPQILTETLYALSQSATPFVPTEVHVVTTSEGAHRIRLQLLDEKNGKFHAFCRDYGLTGRISFPPQNVKVLTDFSGKSLHDIVSPQDNEYAADQIVAWLRSFTSDRDSAIHACLAGGRKTMGFYLGYGMSLYGREQDRLSHVLVSPEFEGHREFFYKPPTAQTLFARSMVGAHVDERPVSTSDANIWLAEIPFVRLRDGLPAALLEGKASYTDAVQAVQDSLPDNSLLIDFSQKQVVCGGIAIKLPPRELAFYAWHAQRHIMLGADAAIGWKDTLGENNILMTEYFDTYLAALGRDALQPDYIEARRAFINGFGKDDWAGMVHHVNARIS